jgi:predicted  nucleic acid-binding Zn-ribbon protein
MEELGIIERDDFISIKIKCKLFNSVTGELVGEAIGSSNSREEKYVSQTTARLCPECGKAAIIKGKEEYGGGWLCYTKKDGCGAKFSDDDKRMIQDSGGAINGTKVWGLYHTLESIAQKRAYVKAVRNATACSDIFTDEDSPQDDERGQQGSPHARTQSKPTTTPKASAIQVRDLNAALMEHGIGTNFPDSIPKAEHAERGKKVRLGWVNDMLKDGELEPVNGMSELAPEIIERLTVAAKAGTVPQGW